MKTRVRRSGAVMGLSLLLSAAGCAADVASSEDVGLETEALARRHGHAPQVPKEIEVPAGQELAFVLDAEGDQIYGCAAAAAGGYAWTLQRPDAELYGKRGKHVGHHDAGPIWQLFDGSSVTGMRVNGATPDASAIPWLLLKASAHDGQGRMSKIEFIQRRDTVGGLAPTSGCDQDHVGHTVSVPYTATYYFYQAACGGKH